MTGKPTTEAGRAMLAGAADALGITSESALGTHGEQFRERFHDALTDHILAIEAEARADERKRLRAASDGLPDTLRGYSQERQLGWKEHRASVHAALALLERSADQ